jgi:hypothetical protein
MRRACQQLPSSFPSSTWHAACQQLPSSFPSGACSHLRSSQVAQHARPELARPLSRHVIHSGERLLEVAHGGAEVALGAVQDAQAGQAVHLGGGEVGEGEGCGEGVAGLLAATARDARAAGGWWWCAG